MTRERLASSSQHDHVFAGTIGVKLLHQLGAALEVLMGPDGMQSLLIRAVAAATKRSKELAK